MTAEKILEVVRKYRSFLEMMHVRKVKFPEDRMPQCKQDGLEHCHWMLDEIEKFVNEGRIEKSFRWLGFVQCCLWTSRNFTINQLAEHNRPTE